MRDPFRAGKRGLEVRLPVDEREMLASLLHQLDDLLDDGRPVTDDPFAELAVLTGGAEADTLPTPSDPALARLLPDAHRDDPEVAAEFRRLTETGLRARKRVGARRAAEALRRKDPVVLQEDEAQALLKSLTDLRLVLGERLGLETDDDSIQLELQLRLGIEPYEGWLPLAATYETLRWLQEALVHALTVRRR